MVWCLMHRDLGKEIALMSLRSILATSLMLYTKSERGDGVDACPKMGSWSGKKLGGSAMLKTGHVVTDLLVIHIRRMGVDISIVKKNNKERYMDDMVCANVRIALLVARKHLGDNR